MDRHRDGLAARGLIFSAAANMARDGYSRAAGSTGCSIERIGRREGVLKGLVERLFVPLPLALAANRIVPVSAVFWLGDHLDLLDRVLKI